RRPGRPGRKALADAPVAARPEEPVAPASDPVEPAPAGRAREKAAKPPQKPVQLPLPVGDSAPGPDGYKTPPLELLGTSAARSVSDVDQQKTRADLQRTLDQFLVEADVTDRITPGPTVTRYAIKLRPGVK